VAALETGHAVFCQKPLARSAAETVRIVAAAERAGRLLGVDYAYRHTDALRRIHDLVHTGALGRLYAMDLTFHSALGPEKSWFHDKQASGGGCLMDLGTHLVDLALWILGFPAVEVGGTRLFARGERLRHDDARVEDFASATLDAGSVSVRLACSWRVPAGRDAVIDLQLWGSESGAAVRNLEGSIHELVAERFDGPHREVLSAPPDNWGGRALVEWTRRLAAGEGSTTEGRQFVAVAEVLDRIYGRRGEP